MKTVSTDKDAYVDEGTPDTNFGGSLSLIVRWQSSVLGGNDREALVGFDLSSIFTDADVLEILAATLKIPPIEADDGESLDAHEIPPGDWSEGQVTWNNKPAAGTLQDTEDTHDDPHAWNVLDEVQAAFDDEAQDRVGFLLQLQEGLAGEENTVEYDSREADSGDEPELELETREQRRSDLASDVEVTNSGTADLDSFVEVKFFHDRWLGGRQDGLVDADGSSYTLNDVAWDPSLGQFWATPSFDGAIVHRHERDGSHDATFEVHEDGSQLDTDVRGVAVADDGTVFVALSDDSDTVAECTVDEANEALDVQTRNTAHDVTPDWLTFDGTRVWILEFFDGDVEERHPTNWALNRSGSVGGGDTFRGIARAPDQDELVLWDDSDGELETQDPDDLGTVVDRYRRDDVGTGQGLAFRGRSWFGSLFVGDSDDTGSDVWTYAPREIQGQVRVPTKETANLSTQVQPGSIPATADLDSQVATGSSSDLSSQVTPKVSRTADLDSQVQPAGLTSTADLTSIVEVTAVPITDDHMGRATGRVAPTVDISEDDMRDVSGEVGTAVTVDPDGDARDLRRVVHLLDSEQQYPRARTDPATTLHRGDAVLYAQQGDELAVGQTVRWQGRDWRVLGLLGWEMVGDSRLYQEVGLRRLATVHEARSIGTVQREDKADLYSEVEVPEAT